MERLTKRNSVGEVYIAGTSERDFKKNAIVIAKRLAELEDKLEKAQMIELPLMAGCDAYIVKKDKYGQYHLRQMTLVSYKVTTGNFVKVYFANQKRYIRGGYPDIEPDRDCSMLGRFGKDWFADFKQAEARLKELRGQ